MSLVIDGTIGRDGFSRAVSLEVSNGTTLGIVGRNGSGKSTLLHTIAGLCPLRSGSMLFDGTVWDDAANNAFVVPERRGCSVVFQDIRLFPHMTCLQNVMFGLLSGGTGRNDAREQAMSMLQELGADAVADSRASMVSGGQAQRVALARALVRRPGVLLLDEPLSAIDADSRDDLRRLLGRVLSGFDGVAVVVSHHGEDLASLADSVTDLGR